MNMVIGHKFTKLAVASLILTGSVANVSACSKFQDSSGGVQDQDVAMPLATASAPSNAPHLPDPNTVGLTGAAQTLDYFFNSLNYGFTTRDTDPMSKVATLGCGPCSEWIKGIATMRDDNSTLSGGLITVVQARASKKDDLRNRYDLEVVLLRSAGELKQADGKVLAVPGGRDDVLVTIAKTDAPLGGHPWTIESIAPAGPFQIVEVVKPTQKS